MLTVDTVTILGTEWILLGVQVHVLFFSLQALDNSNMYEEKCATLLYIQVGISIPTTSLVA